MTDSNVDYRELARLLTKFVAVVVFIVLMFPFLAIGYVFGFFFYTLRSGFRKGLNAVDDLLEWAHRK